MKAGPVWPRQGNKVVVGRDVRKAGDCACWHRLGVARELVSSYSRLLPLAVYLLTKLLID